MSSIANNAFAALNDSDSDNEGPSSAAPVTTSKATGPSKSSQRRAKRAVKNKTTLNTGAVANKGSFNANASVDREDTKRSKDTQKKASGARGREFDRHVSGTGRGREGKKGGAGKHNWGKEGEGAEEGAAGEKRETTGADGEVVVEEEDNSLTYEEYLAQQKKEKANLGAAFAPKKVGFDFGFGD